RRICLGGGPSCSEDSGKALAFIFLAPTVCLHLRTHHCREISLRVFFPKPVKNSGAIRSWPTYSVRLHSASGLRTYKGVREPISSYSSRLSRSQAIRAIIPPRG